LSSGPKENAIANAACKKDEEKINSLGKAMDDKRVKKVNVCMIQETKFVNLTQVLQNNLIQEKD
jgi:hypothetical protein